MRRLLARVASGALGVLLVVLPANAQAKPPVVKIDWSRTTVENRTTPTLQVVVNPLLRRDSPIHAKAFAALRDLGADYVRFVPWYPYPRLAIAEMAPPRDGKLSWDMSLIDPLTIDFLDATKGHPVVLNFSTIPQWMFKTSYEFSFPADPNEAVWTYVDGTELRDPSNAELADYYARLVSWYTKGGFTDRFGRRHDSGHSYQIDYWEVFNEPEFEHQMTPEQYTERYDAIVGAIRTVSPKTKFVGISLAYPAKQPRFFEYFLDKRNHKPGIPLDMISFHFYAQPPGDVAPEDHAPIFFDQASRFVDTVRYIDTTRRRLSPETKMNINEVGSILPDDVHQELPGMVYRTPAYWSLSGAMFAYLYIELARLGVDVLAESQLVGYPGQFPSVTMLDWETGAPNARYWVLKLLVDHARPGDRFVTTSIDSPYVEAQAYVAANGDRKLLLVNKRDRPVEVEIPGADGATVVSTDTATGSSPPKTAKQAGERVALGGFSVTVLTLRTA